MKTTYPELPFPDTYWLTSEILAGELPIASISDFTDLKLESLLNAGIRSFINLTQEDNFNYDELLQQVANRINIEAHYFSFPIKDMDIPSIAQMQTILDTIDASLKDGKPVYYHCYAGLGRTGMVSACWLKRHNNLEGKEILRQLQEIRDKQHHKPTCESPETEKQREFVLQWQFGL